MSIRERLDELDARERRLLAILVVTFVVFLLLLVPLGVTALVGSKQTESEELREAIDAIRASEQELAEQAAERKALETKYGRPAPPLAGFLATQAEASELEIPESQDQASIPHGKQYEERSTKIVLRKTGMLNLLKFMERIEQARHPISISRLNIRKRGTESDSYDVQMIVSAFDRKVKEKPKAKAPSSEEGEDGAEPEELKGEEEPPEEDE